MVYSAWRLAAALLGTPAPGHHPERSRALRLSSFLEHRQRQQNPGYSSHPNRQQGRHAVRGLDGRREHPLSPTHTRRGPANPRPHGEDHRLPQRGRSHQLASDRHDSLETDDNVYVVTPPGRGQRPAVSFEAQHRSRSHLRARDNLSNSAGTSFAPRIAVAGSASSSPGAIHRHRLP